MASLVFTAGGDFLDFPYEKEPRKPQIQVTLATPELVKFTLTDTDISVANALRRIMIAEVPTMAIEIVNVVENETVLFDEFIAHRMGLLPLSCHCIGDIPPDEKLPGGMVEHKDCSCFDGCPYCTVEFMLDVHNAEDKVKNITHFDLKDTKRFSREGVSSYAEVRPCPFPVSSTSTDQALIEQDKIENGILISKLKKDQHLRMSCLARKGIPKYHAKFMPVATSQYNYEPIIELKRDVLDSFSLDQKVEVVQSCPRKVFGLDIEDKVQVERKQDCIYCDECVTKVRDLGKKDSIVVKQDLNIFHFTVEAVTPDGPRSVIDVVRASMRVLDYKLSYFLKDAYDDEIDSYLPLEPSV